MVGIRPLIMQELLLAAQVCWRVYISRNTEQRNIRAAGLVVALTFFFGMLSWAFSHNREMATRFFICIDRRLTRYVLDIYRSIGLRYRPVDYVVMPSWVHAYAAGVMFLPAWVVALKKASRRLIVPPCISGENLLLALLLPAWWARFCDF